MSRKIIVPIDLPDEGKAAKMIKAAHDLGGDDAQITIVHVVADVPTYVAAELPGGVLDKVEESAETELADMAKSMGVKADIEVHRGQPATVILGVAKEKSADIIIVASHHPGLADYFLGSTAARVVRHADCSVYILR